MGVTGPTVCGATTGGSLWPDDTSEPGEVVTAERPIRSLPPAKFPAESASIAVSRHRLEDFLYDVPHDVRMVAALLLSELTTNVVRHARTHFSLCAEVTPSSVRVEVADGLRDPPVVRDPGPRDVGGRGMVLVSELADDWGTESMPEGKLVWFELSLVHAEDVGQPGDLEDSPHER
jgi:anti-sigma regulatory factor (Ser/Thr protein kinase)